MRILTFWVHCARFCHPHCTLVPVTVKTTHPGDLYDLLRYDKSDLLRLVPLRFSAAATGAFAFKMRDRIFDRKEQDHSQEDNFSFFRHSAKYAGRTGAFRLLVDYTDFR